jgi:hypothetical protein
MKGGGKEKMKKKEREERERDLLGEDGPWRSLHLRGQPRGKEMEKGGEHERRRRRRSMLDFGVRLCGQLSVGNAWEAEGLERRVMCEGT